MVTYKVRVYCRNCGFNKRIDIPVGILVNKHPCPNCQCFSLEFYDLKVEMKQRWSL